MKDQKICTTCGLSFCLEKKWKETGKMFFIAVKGVERINKAKLIN